MQAETNTRQLSAIDPERMAFYAKALGPAQELFQQRASTGANRAVYTIYPTDAYAQEAGMLLREYEDFVFNAGLLFEDDPVAAWARVEQEQQRYVDFLNQCTHIRIVAEDTDLEYRCAGRNWINGAGKIHFRQKEINFQGAWWGLRCPGILSRPVQELISTCPGISALHTQPNFSSVLAPVCYTPLQEGLAAG